MKVSQLIAKLNACNPDAEVEVRGHVGNDYISESVDSVDDCDDLVVLDI